MPRSTFISIIVPVLNEANPITLLLARLRTLAPQAEIIVVDGGSSDGTWLLAEKGADLVIDAARGRAAQMNAGAAVARGDVLWFLHADLEPSPHSLREIERVLRDRAVVGGCFRLRFRRPELIYRISDVVGNIGVALFGFALGDHGIFCRRAAFDRVGGYPDIPIFEDAQIYRKLARAGVMVQLQADVCASPRAYEKHGPYRTTAVYFAILALYVFGAPIRLLHRIHQRFREGSVPTPVTAAVAHAVTYEADPAA